MSNHCGYCKLSNYHLIRHLISGKIAKMVKTEQTTTAEGVVTEALPNTMFRVEITPGRLILCTLAGKMRMNYIKVMPGDRVKVEISPYDLTKGRIVYRQS